MRSKRLVMRVSRWPADHPALRQAVAEPRGNAESPRPEFLHQKRLIDPANPGAVEDHLSPTIVSLTSLPRAL